MRRHVVSPVALARRVLEEGPRVQSPRPRRMSILAGLFTSDEFSTAGQSERS
jgi:hypothetical protein